MGKCEEINAKIVKYERKLNDEQNSLKKLEQEYDELVRFKGAVGRSEADFNVLNKNRVKAVKSIEKYANCNNVIKKYCESMNNFFVTLGNKILSLVYDGLLAKISIELLAMKTKMSIINSNINRFGNLIDDYQDKYDKEKEMLESEA